MGGAQAPVLLWLLSAADACNSEVVTPPLDELLARLYVVALPMRVRFRGIMVREVALIDGPAGWGEFGAFLEYEPPEAAHWLAAGIEAAYSEPPSPLRDRIPINATVPAVERG